MEWFLIIKWWLILSAISVFLSVLRDDWGVMVIEDISIIERNTSNILKRIFLVIALYLIYAFRIPKTIYVIIKNIFQ